MIQLLHFGDIVDPPVGAVELLFLGCEVLVLVDGDGVGRVRGAVHVVAALGGVVLALKLLNSARPSLRVEYFGPLVFFEGLFREVGKLVEEGEGLLPLLLVPRDAVHKKYAMS